MKEQNNKTSQKDLSKFFEDAEKVEKQLLPTKVIIYINSSVLFSRTLVGLDSAKIICNP